MKKSYSRMTWTDRLNIEKLFNAGATYRTISQKTGFAISAVYYEVQRGLYDHLDGSTWKILKRYSARIAQDDADWQATIKGCPIKLGNRHAYAKDIATRILSGESPDQIIGDLKRRNKWTVSTPTLYRYIDQGYIPGVTNKDLRDKSRRKKRTYKKVKAARAPKGTSIERRPKEINDRSTFGHWEMDSVIGKARGKKESLLVLTERMTRYEIIIKATAKTSAATVSALSKIVKRFPKGTFQSVTVDNGSEFQDADGIQALINAL
ncbi:MAG: IS30 family transposase, partial [Ruminococcus flavefaciens]|nr:IS30 family transposase [Ruminococcus flavefaciens]